MYKTLDALMEYLDSLSTAENFNSITFGFKDDDICHVMSEQDDKTKVVIFECSKDEGMELLNHWKDLMKAKDQVVVDGTKLYADLMRETFKRAAAEMGYGDDIEAGGRALGMMPNDEREKVMMPILQAVFTEMTGITEDQLDRTLIEMQ